MPQTEIEQLNLASDIEILVYLWLVNHGVVFDFQSQLIGGYSRQVGDATVDFVLIDLYIVLRVQGAYWHTGVDVEAKDRFQRSLLEGQGWTVVDIWEDDVEKDIDSVMNLAIKGEEIPH